MKTLLLIIATITTATTMAQDAVWMGGTPGMENDWDVASNWSTNEVPDEDTHVIINFLNSGHNSQPVINSEASAASIEVRSMGQLTIEKDGFLVVDGESNYSEGILLYGGTVNNIGTIHLLNLQVDLSPEQLDLLAGNGKVFASNTAESMNGEIHFASRNTP